MQKFTAFSILFSLLVVLTTADVLFHGYLSGPDTPSQTQTEVVEEADSTDEIQNEEEVQDVEEVDTPVDSPEEVVESTEDQPVELQTQKVDSWLTSDLLTQAGFANPVLKEALFSGLIFQIIPFEDQTEAQSLQLNFFDGENYFGTFYELVYPTDTGSFQGYLSLREAAKSLTELGSVNEVNMYGDASFYFNHKTKVNTIHMVALYGNRIYAFEYSNEVHENMKKLFDILKTLQ